MKMPAMFVGHGSPMNVIEDNEYTRKWSEVANSIPRPKGIICISAHWYTNGKYTNDKSHPKQIYDMYGFPEELYAFKYPVEGSKSLAKEIKRAIDGVKIDNSWGIDHGTWAVLCKMYPKADIPVVQLSIDGSVSVKEHFEIAKKIYKFREQGYLIIGSGNVVHNLRLINPEIDGYDWAYEFDRYIKESILSRDFSKVIDYKSAGASHEKSFKTLEHFLPLIYALGVVDEEDSIEVFNEGCMMGSLSMTSYIFR